MELDAYARALGAAQSLVPSYNQLRLQGLQLEGAQLNNQNAALEGQWQQRRIAAADQDAAQEQAFAAEIRALGANPTPDQFRQIGARFPQFAKGLNDAATSLESGQRQRVVSDTARMLSAIRAKRPEVAQAIVQRHIDADTKAGGQPDPDDVALLDMLKSGDAGQLEAASGMLYGVLTSFDPDSAAKNIGEYASPTQDKRYVVGRALVDQQGNALYRDPDPVQYKEVDGSLYAVGGGNGSAKGGGPASTGGRADGNFDSFHRNFLGPTEGGYADRDGASGAPVNFGVNQKANPDINVRSLTPEQGKAILRDRYWKQSGADKLPAGLAEVHGDTAVNMGVETANRLLRQSGGNAERYLQLREQRYKSIGGPNLRNWLNRNNKLREYVGLQDGAPVTGGGSPQLVVQGKPKQGYTVVSPQEAQAQGLDPTVRYQRSPEGAITAIGGQGRSDTRKVEADFRKEFDGLPEVKTFKSSRPQFQSLRALATKPNPTPQDDIALIFNFMKTLDPASVVREGEFATAQNAGGVPDNIRNLYNRAREGTRLNPAQRRSMLGTAYQAYKAQREAYNGAAERYRSYARDNGVSPDRVARTYTPDTPTQALKPGMVRRGYRYKGGNPATPSSWVKL